MNQMVTKRDTSTIIWTNLRSMAMKCKMKTVCPYRTQLPTLIKKSLRQS